MKALELRLLPPLIVLACVLVVGIFIWVFDAVGGVVVNGIITLVKG